MHKINKNTKKLADLTGSSTYGISTYLHTNQSTGATTTTSISTNSKQKFVIPQTTSSFSSQFPQQTSSKFKNDSSQQITNDTSITQKLTQGNKRFLQTASGSSRNQNRNPNQPIITQIFNKQSADHTINAKFSKTGSSSIGAQIYSKLNQTNAQQNLKIPVNNQSQSSCQSITMMQAGISLSNISGASHQQQNSESSNESNQQQQIPQNKITHSSQNTQQVTGLFSQNVQQQQQQLQQSTNSIITPYFSKSMNKLKGIVEYQQPFAQGCVDGQFSQQSNLISSRNLSNKSIYSKNLKKSNSSQKNHYISLSNKVKQNNQVSSRLTSPQIDEIQLQQIKQDLLRQYQNFELQHENKIQKNNFISPDNKQNQQLLMQNLNFPSLNFEEQNGITSLSQQKTDRKQEIIQLQDSPSSQFSPEGTAKRQSTQPDHKFCDDLDNQKQEETPRVHRTLTSCLEEESISGNGIPIQETVISLNERRTDIKQHIDQQNAINELGSFACNHPINVMSFQNAVDNVNCVNSSQAHFNKNHQELVLQQPCLDIVTPQSPGDINSLIKQNEIISSQTNNQDIRKFDINSIYNFPSDICSPVSQILTNAGCLNSYNTVIQHDLNEPRIQNQQVLIQNIANKAQIKNSTFNFVQRQSRNNDKTYRPQESGSNFYFNNLIESEAQKFFNMQKQRKISQLNDPQCDKTCNDNYEDNSFKSSDSDSSQQSQTITSMYSDLNQNDHEDAFSVPSSAKTSNFKIQKTLDQQLQQLNTQNEMRSSIIEKRYDTLQYIKETHPNQQIQLIEGISGQGFQFQTFSENPQNKIQTDSNFDLEYANTIAGMPATLIRQQSNTKFSQTTNKNILRNSNQDTASLSQVKLLDNSKATPAFKKTMKDKQNNQLTSNMTSNTLSSNHWRFSNASDHVQEFQEHQNESIEHSQHQDSLLETSENLDFDRMIPKSRLLVKKQPASLNRINNIPQNKQQKRHQTVKSSSKVIIKQDEKQKNVYHFIGQSQDKQIKHKKPSLKDSKQVQNTNQRVQTQPINTRQQQIKAKRDLYQNLENQNKCNISDSSQIRTNFLLNQNFQSAKRLTTNNLSSNKDNSNYGVFGNDMLLQSFLITQHPTKDSYLLTQNLYHPSETNPTMIRKQSSSCSFCSECCDDDDDDHTHSQLSSQQSIIHPQTSHSNMQSQQAFVNTMFSQKRDGSQPGSHPRLSINKRHQVSMDRLSENQINEGVVYQSNGFGQPTQYLMFNQSFKKNQGTTASMATTSASLVSGMLYDQQRKIVGSLNRQNDNQKIQMKIPSNQMSRNQSHHNSQNSLQLNAYLSQNSAKNQMFNNNYQYFDNNQQNLQNQNQQQRRLNHFGQRVLYQSQNFQSQSLTQAQQLQEAQHKQNMLRMRVNQNLQNKLQLGQVIQQEHQQPQIIDTSVAIKYRPSITQNDMRLSQNFNRLSISNIQRVGSSNDFDQNSSPLQFKAQTQQQQQYYIDLKQQMIQQQRLQQQNQIYSQIYSNNSTRQPSLTKQNPNVIFQTQKDQRQMMTQNFNQRHFQSFRDNSIIPNANPHQNNLVLNQITETNQTDSSVDLLPYRDKKGYHLSQSNQIPKPRSKIQRNQNPVYQSNIQLQAYSDNISSNNTHQYNLEFETCKPIDRKQMINKNKSDNQLKSRKEFINYQSQQVQNFTEIQENFQHNNLENSKHSKNQSSQQKNCSIF